jgi:hypothetical protein
LSVRRGVGGREESAIRLGKILIKIFFHNCYEVGSHPLELTILHNTCFKSLCHTGPCCPLLSYCRILGPEPSQAIIQWTPSSALDPELYTAGTGRLTKVNTMVFFELSPTRTKSFFQGNPVVRAPDSSISVFKRNEGRFLALIIYLPEPLPCGFLLPALEILNEPPVCAYHSTTTLPKPNLDQCVK